MKYWRVTTEDGFLWGLWMSLVLFCACACSTPEQIASAPYADKKLKSPFSLCRKYTDRKIFEYCIYQKASHLFSVEEVHFYCAMAGDWEESCRHTWGLKRVRMIQEHRIDLETLLDGCRGL